MTKRRKRHEVEVSHLAAMWLRAMQERRPRNLRRLVVAGRDVEEAEEWAARVRLALERAQSDVQEASPQLHPVHVESIARELVLHDMLPEREPGR